MLGTPIAADFSQSALIQSIRLRPASMSPLAVVCRNGTMAAAVYAALGIYGATQGVILGDASLLALFGIEDSNVVHISSPKAVETLVTADILTQEQGIVAMTALRSVIGSP